MKKVSVVIVNYNGEKHLDDCLSSLLSQDYPEMEIIVVDNASSDRSEEIVRKYKGVKFIKSEKNLGLAEGCNVGARESNGEYICFVNNDMRFERDFISKLAEVLDSSSDIFAADALHYNWSGDRILHAGTVLRKTSLYKGHIPGFLSNPVAVIDKKLDVPWGCLANLMVKRDMFFELGGFDSTFFIDYEDADLCWRAWLRGWKTVFTPFAKAYHKVGMSSDEFQKVELKEKINQKRALSQHKNYIRFILKTMDINIIIRMLLIAVPARIIGYFIKGRYILLWAQMRSLIITIVELKDIIKERRNIKHNLVLTNSYLFDKFLNSE